MTPPVTVLGALDPNLGWEGGRLHRRAEEAGPSIADLSGAFADVVARGDGSTRVVRDGLGLAKLFWGRHDGEVLVASRPRSLVDAGIPFGEVRAVPSGCDVVVGDGSRPSARSTPSAPARPTDGDDVESADIAAVGRRAFDRIDAYLAAVAAAHPSTPAFVCLSGGLDSTAVAVVARRHLPDLVGVTFDLAAPSDPVSDDRRTARRLARHLGMPLLEIVVTPDDLLAHLDDVLVHGIDWRDFNVHAGLVNAALAAGIRDALPPAVNGEPPPALVLTGDLANELLADYSPVSYRGHTYYRLPRVGTDALRDWLVRGLDTTHREIGVFAAWGLTTVQPYAVAVDDYLALPGSFLSSPEAKAELNRAALGDEIPAYVYERPKVRAQVGGEEVGGVLAACVDRGVDAAALRRRFLTLHDTDDESVLARAVRSGRYRSEIPDLGVDGER